LGRKINDGGSGACVARGGQENAGHAPRCRSSRGPNDFARLSRPRTKCRSDLSSLSPTTALLLPVGKVNRTEKRFKTSSSERFKKSAGNEFEFMVRDGLTRGVTRSRHAPTSVLP